MTVSEYLLDRLAQLGIRHLFGVPGDFNLWFLEDVLNHPKIDFVGCCNELNASYAADGYARVSGIAAIATTYGVGELAAIAGVAGAYAEKNPIVCITGAPPLSAIEEGSLIHHTLADGNYDNMMNCYRAFTVEQTRLTPENAAEEIDRVLIACWRERRPVYLQLPSDIAGVSIAQSPTTLLDLAIRGDRRKTDEAVTAFTDLLEHAISPAILIDLDVDRFDLLASLLDIAEKRDIPIAHLVTARGILTDAHPRNIGVYRGAGSAEEVKNVVERADCLICVGVRLTDVATGLFTHHLPQEHVVDVQSSWVSMAGRRFEDVRAGEFLQRTAEQLAVGPGRAQYKPPTQSIPVAQNQRPDPSDQALNQDVFWKHIQHFIQPGDLIVSDTGTASFASSNLKLPEGTRYLTQPIWGALGYGLPAALGAGCADETRRLILFVGDGGLQMSVQELSTIIWRGLKPIIFLLNNDGYTIERLIFGPESKYNDISPWHYSMLPRVFGGEDVCRVQAVRTSRMLEDALLQTQASGLLHMIEVILPRLDAPAPLIRFARKAAEFDFPQLSLPAKELERSTFPSAATASRNQLC